MAINAEKNVIDIVADGQTISEVYAGDKKVWGKDEGGPVPPYAMLHAMKTATPISLQSSNYDTSFEDKILSISATTRTAWLGVLMADGGTMTLKNGTTETLTLTRSGNTVTCFSRSDRNNTGTSTVTFSSTTHPFVPVAVQISSRANGYYLQVRANNSLGNQVSIYSSGFLPPTDNFKSTNGTMNSLCFGFQWTTSYYASDWRYSNMGTYDGSKWFQQAMQFNVGWDDFFGQPRQWGELDSTAKGYTKKTHGWRYTNPASQKVYSYSLPEGVRYSEEFWLAGGYQDYLKQGGRSGDGGRPTNSRGELACADISFSDGRDGSNYYWPHRYAFKYTRTINYSKTTDKVLVGRGSQYCHSRYYSNSSQETPRNNGYLGGKGGYSSSPTNIHCPTYGYQKATEFSYRNTPYGTRYSNHENESVIDTTMYFHDGISSHSLINDYYNSLDGYNSLHPTVPSITVGLHLSTFKPVDNAPFTLSDTYWAREKDFYTIERPVRFYSNHTGDRLSWPPEPTCKNRKSEYDDICAPGFGQPGVGGKKGADATGISGAGMDGESSGSSYSDAGGTGLAVFFYSFQEPKVI